MNSLCCTACDLEDDGHGKSSRVDELQDSRGESKESEAPREI